MSQPNEKTFMAGAARVDISPPLGTQIAGDIGRYRPADRIEEPIYANAVVMAIGDRKVAIVSVELLIMMREHVDPIRQEAARAIGTVPEAIGIHATQNHSAPALGQFAIDPDLPYIPEDHKYLCGCSPEYIPIAHRKIVQAITQANENLQPASLGLGTTMETRVGFNRRFLMRDGSACKSVRPEQYRDMVMIEGPTDPQVGVAGLVDDHGKLIAVLLHHTSHPVDGFDTNTVLGSWPGVWASLIEEHSGGQAVPVVLNGMCGNIRNRNFLEPDTQIDYRTQGRFLAEKTIKVLDRMRYDKPTVLDWQSSMLPLNWRYVSDEMLAQAKQVLRDQPTPPWIDRFGMPGVEWRWMYAVMRLDLHAQQQKCDTLDYEVQVMRIGDLGLLLTPGEPFVEGQLAIKLGSPAGQTMVAHYSNDYFGYIPTARAIQRGGFETDVGKGSKVAPESLERIVRHSVAGLEKLFPDVTPKDPELYLELVRH